MKRPKITYRERPLLFDDTAYFPLFSGICQQQPNPQKFAPRDVYRQASITDADQRQEKTQ